MSQTLRGACACGRNRYTVSLPHAELERVEVQFDTSNATRRHHTSPFTTFLRVPLPWYTSATYAQRPDETHTHIRRTFESPFASHTRRQFCGYCGTQLSSWSEQTREEAEYISLTLGSVIDEDLELLEELGLLPEDDEEDSEEAQDLGKGGEVQTMGWSVRDMGNRGMPWFEEVVRDTPFGRMKRQKGKREARDGAVKVEWEIVEWTEGDEEDVVGVQTPLKRKLEDVEKEEKDDVVMH